MQSIADLLRREIEQSKQTLSEIARATSIPQPRLWNFIHADQSAFKLESAEKLLTYFGYAVVKKARRPTSPRASKPKAVSKRRRRRA